MLGQVFNRENGHAGFMLSCYDAEFSYDSRLDNFTARFSDQGRPTMEHDIEWVRIRASTVNTSAHDLHPSDCLDDLQPGDHVEIQWRKYKDFSYGWWYGVVGHLGPCDRCKLHYQCHSSGKQILSYIHTERMVIEFKQCAAGSQWRETTIDRKDHSERGDELYSERGDEGIENKQRVLSHSFSPQAPIYFATLF